MTAQTLTRRSLLAGTGKAALVAPVVALPVAVQAFAGPSEYRAAMPEKWETLPYFRREFWRLRMTADELQERFTRLAGWAQFYETSDDMDTPFMEELEDFLSEPRWGGYQVARLKRELERELKLKGLAS